MKYQFIQKHQQKFGVRWLLRRMRLVPNGYYQFVKNKTRSFVKKRRSIQKTIVEIYHENRGVPGHRSMQQKLADKGINISKTTCHKYMQALSLRSVVRRKPRYGKQIAHHIFPDLIGRDFNADKANQKWYIDFTYIHGVGGKMFYNCAIIDGYNRAIIASSTSKSMTSELAIDTIKKAIQTQPKIKQGLILHSDQGVQFTSAIFIKYCEEQKIQQSMSRAGTPLDNAIIERYFNTLKHEAIYIFDTMDFAPLSTFIARFVTQYNYARPHTYNGGKPPLSRTA